MVSIYKYNGEPVELCTVTERYVISLYDDFYLTTDTNVDQVCYGNQILQKKINNNQYKWKLPSEYSASVGETIIKFIPEGSEITILRVPSALSESQVTEIFNEVLALAFQLKNPNTINIDNFDENKKYGMSLVFEEDIEKLICEIEKYWPIVQKKPCKSLKTGKTAIKIEKSIQAKHLVIRKTNPEKLVVEANSRVESFDTPENRWLKLVLEIALPNYIRQFIYDKLKRDSFLLRLKKMADTPFLTSVTLCEDLPNATRRLQEKEGYESIYRAYHNRESILKELKPYASIKSKFENQIGTKKFSNIYEIWCLFQIGRKIRSLGYENTARSIADVIAWSDENGWLEIKNTKDNGKYFTYIKKENVINLSYDSRPQVRIKGQKNHILIDSDLRPDFVIQKNDERPVILDAKYHEYDFLGGIEASHSQEKTLRHDIQEIASKKYAGKLFAREYADHKFRPSASIIIHPNTNEKYQWIWLISHILNQRYEDFIRVPPNSPDHILHTIRCMALIPLRPGRHNQLFDDIFKEFLG